MNHGNGGWKYMLPMLLCCVVMVAVFVLIGLGVFSFR